MTLETRPSSGDGLFLQSCASDVMAHVSYRLPDTAKVYFDAPRMASVASINSSLWCLFAWARPPTVLLTQLADDANADFFFFFPFVFCSHYCNSARMAMHQHRLHSHCWSFFIYFFLKKKLPFFFYPNGDDFADVRSSFLTGPIEIHSLRLALQYQNQRWWGCFWIIASYYVWFTYIFHF